MKYALLLSFSIFASMALAQETLRIGDWRSFLSYRTGLSVTQDDDKVYYGSENGLVSITKDSLDTRFFSKVDGLNDVGIRLIRYHRTQNALIVIYSNSNIDLVFADGIVNVDKIAINDNIVGSRLINDVFVDDPVFIYFSCDFGLVQFNMETLKFGYTLFSGMPIHQYTTYRDTLYLAAESGIFRFAGSGSNDPADFNAWERLGEAVALPAAYQGEGVVVHSNTLFAAADGAVYRYDDGVFTLIDVQEDRYINFMSNDGDYLIAGFRCPGDVCNGEVAFYTVDGKAGSHGFDCTGRPTYAIGDASGRIWYANEFDGMRYASEPGAGCGRFTFDAPYSNRVSEIAVKDNDIYIASGGVSDRYNALLLPDGFAIYRDGTWHWRNRTNHDQLSAIDPLDYFRILPDRDSNVVFIGTYFSGLLKYDIDADHFTYYDQDNSALQGAVGDEARERVAGLAFDDDGNLWMSCYLAPRPIVVMKNDGTWANYQAPSSTELGQVIVDRRGYKWFAVISSNQGVLVFDDNGTPDNTADDRYATFNTSNSELSTNSVTNLTMDLDGDIWVGTAEGPVIFDGVADPFGEGPHGFRVKIDQEGIIAYLLSEEEITCIAVDGANRKWFGTRNGIFVQSADGEDEIARYNTSNSPLLHNQINDIAINPENGEVFIGTAAGLISVRTDAVVGGTLHRSDAFAYPNPVTPDYEGPIAIRGLARDAAVKITDVTGTLVYETRALGGQAIWYGEDLKGRRVQSGVYLVFSTTEPDFDKPDAIVTKILVVN